MRWNIVVKCVGEDGKQPTISGHDWTARRDPTAENLGLNLQESKRIVNRLQDTIVKDCRSIVNKDENVSPVARWRPVKDYRRRRKIKRIVICRIIRFFLQHEKSVRFPFDSSFRFTAFRLFDKLLQL